MGGCAASRMGRAAAGEEEGDVVALCRDRKRLLKLAVGRRYALAEAHCRYLHSLQSVAAALHLFVARHSAPAAPFLITLPVSGGEEADPPPLPRPPAPPEALGSLPARSSSSSASSSCSLSSEEELCGEAGGAPAGCPYFFSEAPVAEQQEGEMMGWDFFSFNPFCGVVTGGGGSGVGGGRSWDEELRVVREQEGIPELEEEEAEGQQEKEKVHRQQEEEGREVVSAGGVGGNVGGKAKQEKGLTVVETPGRERELLEALRDVEDHFIRAYDSGKEVSKMLEVNRVHLHSGLEEIKENSSKIINAITWHRTPSQSSSFRSSLGSSSKSSSSTWTHYNNELFDDYGGMESGCHSLTLGRLYEWEKKLYDEVKAGDQTRRMYEQKCALLRKKDACGDDPGTVDKTRNVVKDLYTRIWVAFRTAGSISNRIQKLRDEELQPQLVELLKGLMTTWKVMLESHETQNRIMFEVKSFTSSAYGRYCGNPHRHATLQLETEIQNWRTCFMTYIAAQRSYVEALSGWLFKFLAPEVEFCSQGRSSVLPYRVGAPPLVVICHDWLKSLEKLPDSAVVCSMKSFTRDVRALWVQQGEEQQQKRKVDSLAKELDRKVLAFQRTENRILESKLADKTEPDVRQRVEYLAGRKDLLDMCRNRLDIEKGKHHDCMQETQRIILSGFQTGFTSVFESLTEFSKASLNMYSELVAYSEKAKFAHEKPSCREGSQDEVDSG